MRRMTGKAKQSSLYPPNTSTGTGLEMGQIDGKETNGTFQPHKTNKLNGKVRKFLQHEEGIFDLNLLWERVGIVRDVVHHIQHFLLTV